ncbi:MAG TPA: GNAT family N-acetyltransferase [Kofleriaceae bacterium]|nr:GNAT family N-acetyltransferase [Kofleriaceae bacterium]
MTTDSRIDVREVTSADVPAVIELVSATLAEFGLTFGVGSPTDDQLHELRKMYLRPAARGARLGARLLDVALAWSRAQGAVRMVLDTTEGMTRAIAFYEANGFVRDDSYIRGARCSRAYVRAL